MILSENLLHDQKGAAAIQHALVAAVVSLTVLAGSLALREPVIDLYDGMGNQANAALTGEAAGGPLPEKEAAAN